MEYIYNFIKSDAGVSIAWACGVFSTAYAVYSNRKNEGLKKEVQKLKSEIAISQDSINQNGTNNFYTKTNSGGMNIKM